MKSVDDLDLLVKVLEANKAQFAKADRLVAEVLTLTQELRSAPSQSHAEPPALVNRSKDVDADGVVSTASVAT